MNTIRDKQIAIVGGGPGGLTLARLLQLSGAAVKVYERDLHKDARPKGATLDLHEESGLAALRAAGLMDAFTANYRPGADMLRITNKNATVVFDDHLKPVMDRSRPEIDRGPLQNILLDSLQPGTVVWDSHFLSMAPQNGGMGLAQNEGMGLAQNGGRRLPHNSGWELKFKNGSVAFADIVVGADGANSKIRPYITPIKAFYSGYTGVEGAVYHSETACPRVHELLGGGKIFAMGDEKTLIVGSKGDGSLVFYTGCKTPEGWVSDAGIDFSDKTQVISWFKKEYVGWNDIWLELFENASPTFVPRPLYSMPLDQTWEALPNLTILGDAAHLMPPYAGEGVNMAMLDALELSRCLTGEDFAGTGQAIAAYEKQMRARAAEVAKDSLDSTVALHSPEAIPFMLGLLG
jgi:2-polyprenyl-6-methoxyphenol hydroxylase-like FAD-dependent oxidoreductase